MRLTIALAQINTRLGNMQANLEKHLTIGWEASTSGADLIVFPELSLTGYVLQDLASTVAQQANPDDSIFQPLLEESKNIDLVVGFVDEN